MKILVDENIAWRTTDALRKNGHDVLSVHEAGLSGSSDEIILEIAVKQQRIVLTHDKDFGGLIHDLSQPLCGVVLIRLRNQHPDNVIKNLLPFLTKIKESQIQNRLVVLQEGRVRII